MAIQHSITTPQGAKHPKAYTRLDIKRSKVRVVDTPETDTIDETYKLSWRLLVEVKTFVNSAVANDPTVLPLSTTSFWTDIVVEQDDHITAYNATMLRAEFSAGIKV